MDAARPVAYAIPRSIFGTFLEPIGHSIYGGLWAEILENPSFEDDLWSAQNVARMIGERPELARASEMALPLRWEPLYPEQGQRYAPQWNDAANSYRSLLLMGLPDAETGIRQQVYLPVHRVLRYTGNIYLKYLSGPAEAEISLRERNQPQHVLAAQKLELSGREWKKYEYSLQLPPGQLLSLEPADYVVAVRNETRVLVDQASLLPADNMDGMDPDVIEMARAMKTSVVRFGGNFTSAYRWQDGIGPRDKRLTMLNPAWGMPEYNQFGTDEFLGFCQLIGAEPQIALNLGTGTPQGAAAWVQYVNGHWGDHSGGLLWELGNELWGTFQTGYPTQARIAERTRAFSEAIHAADPKARLIGTGADPDHFAEWNQAQLENLPPQTFRYLSTHFVVTTSSVKATHPSADFIARATFALPVGLEQQLRQMRRQFESFQPRDPVKTAFTEWLFWAPDDTYPRYDNMGGALATAGFLNLLLRNADMVPISDMTGILEFGGLWKRRSRVYGTPAYWVFRMYSNADAALLVPAASDGETYSVEDGITRLPSIANVPYLDVVATLNDSRTRLTLFCVNRDLERDLPARIEVASFSPAGQAAVQTLYGDSIYEGNDEMEPERIHPRASAIAVSRRGFTYTFRHESVTVIELQKRD